MWLLGIIIVIIDWLMNFNAHLLWENRHSRPIENLVNLQEALKSLSQHCYLGRGHRKLDGQTGFPKNYKTPFFSR